MQHDAYTTGVCYMGWVLVSCECCVYVISLVEIEKGLIEIQIY